MSEETQERVERKVWTTDSTHQQFNLADLRRRELIARGSEAKVRARTNGTFDVKVWAGRSST